MHRLLVCCSVVPRRRMPVAPYSVGKPTSSLAPVGDCIFTEDWSAAPLVEKHEVSHDTRVFTFGLPDGKPLGLSTCACILAKGSTNAEGEPLVRPYTPVSTNAMVGKFELMVKIYNGGLSKHMDSMAVGDTLEFKHIPFNVKTQYPFAKKHIGMLVGGTGITPMLQALHAILGTEGDTTKVSVLYGNRTEQDILARATLDEWSSMYGDRLSITHVLSEKSDGWTGHTGFIDAALIKKHMPEPGNDNQIWICGPPPMYDALCGPRGDAELSGVLPGLGYVTDEVYKF